MPPESAPGLTGVGAPDATVTEPLPRRRRRVDADVLGRIERDLPDRDRAVLARVAEHRYLTTHQIQAFVFTGHGSVDSAARSTRYVLQRLDRLALLRPLAQRIGGVRAGSSARVWQLAPAGARLLRADGQTFRTHEPSLRFLDHCLAVADAHLGVRALLDNVSDTNHTDDHDPRQDGVESVTVQTEPNCWRRHTGPGGEPRWLQPDLAATISTRRYEDRWFIEVDRGTESLPTLLRKCGAYEAYRATGIEQHKHGAFPLVLWLLPDTQRTDRLRTALLRSPRLTPGLYRLATPGTFCQVLRDPDQASGGGAS